MDDKHPLGDDSTDRPDQSERDRYDDIDAIFDQIDEVLEENAEEFVRSYVQRGGNGGSFGMELAEELKQRLSDEDAFKLFDLLRRIQSLSPELRNELVADRWGSGIANLISDELDNEPDGTFYFLQNLAHFNYVWEPGQLASADLDSALSAHRLLRQARHALLNGDIVAARRALLDVTAADPSMAAMINVEFGFVLRMSPDAAGQAAARWTASIWSAFSDQGAAAQDEEERSVEHLTPAFDDTEQSTSVTSRPVARSDVRQTSQQLGSALEEDTLSVLRILFNTPTKAGAIKFGRYRRQTAGPQFGRDIEFDGTTVENQRVRCHVECKHYTSPISLAEVAGKLAQEELRPGGARDVDHWILISPIASASNELNDAVDQWNASRRYPFLIQLWTRDFKVDELFSLEPSVYERYYQRPATDRPSRDERAEVIDRWRSKLKPHLRVDASLVQYLKDASRQCFVDGSENAKELERIREYAVPLYAVELSGSRSSQLLAEAIDSWLSGENPKKFMVIGDFGDGKTFFTYSRTRSLAEQFLMDPRAGIIPIRIPLRRMRDFPSARDLVNSRLDEIAVSRESWKGATLKYRTVVFLDGFDELSATLDSSSISENVSRLMQCCREFPHSSIVITSRTWFFENGRDRELILPRIGSPEVWRIQPIDKRDAVRFLEATAANDEALEKLSILRRLHDPLGLAKKPLFMDMIRATLPTLPTLPEEGLTEVQLYDLYTQMSLGKKLDDVEAQDAERGIFGYSRSELLDGLQRILEMIAVRLQVSGAPSLDLHLLGYEYDFAFLLWQMTSDGQQSNVTEDATQRVGARSLLRRIPSLGREEWLVDFFHRSVREYYAARGVVSAVEGRSSDDIKMLDETALGPEIKWFACEMIRQNRRSERLIRIEALAKGSVREGRTHFLGGNCITLLAGVLDRLPSADWIGLKLDYADLTGADLSGVNFSNSSLRYAILDDANLESVNFTSCDLTGLRLEETADVQAIAGQEGDIIFAAYADGLLRRWQIMPQRIVANTIAKEIAMPIDCMSTLANGDIVLGCKNSLVIYQEATEQSDLWSKHTQFGIRPDLRIHSLAETAATAHIELGSATEVLVASAKTGRLAERRTLLGKVICSRAWPEAVIAYGTDAGARVESWRDGKLRSKWTLERPDVTAVTMLETEQPEELFVVTGHRDGTLEMVRIGLEDESLDILWCIQPHVDVISSLGSTSEYVIAGSADRSISVISLNAGAVYRCLQRTVRCGGMNIDGVEGAYEREMLRGLLTRASVD